MQMAGGMKMGWYRSLRVLPWLLLAWLASCGGGTQQIEPFQAQRVIFIGDETVGLLPDGRRYGINVDQYRQQLRLRAAADLDAATGASTSASRPTTAAAAHSP